MFIQHNSALAIHLSTVYVLAATGGVEEPSFVTFTDETTARNHPWLTTSQLLQEVGDRVDLLEVTAWGDGTSEVEVLFTVLLE